MKIATGLTGLRGGLRADVIAGVTVAAYLVPQAMATPSWPVYRRWPACGRY